MNRAELERLIHRHLDGLGTHAEIAELSRELEARADSRAVYLRLARLHAALATEEAREDNQSAADAAAFRNGRDDPQPRHATADATAPAGDHQPIPWTRHRPWLAAACFAGLALLLAAGWGLLVGDRDTAAVAVVAHFGPLKEARWVAAGVDATPGDPVRAGQRLELSSGSATIEFASGAVVTLIGPCIFEPRSGNSGFLTLGQLKAVAATPTAKGFTVQTRTARVVDIGTEFVAAAAADGQSRVDVTSGEVDVLVEGVNAPQRLRTGDALAIEAGQPKVLIRIESGDGTAAFRFPTIEPPSALDEADASRGQATIRVARGDLLTSAPIPSGPAELLLDGRGQSRADSPAESVFFDNNASGLLLLDLGRPLSISRINSYSWHQNRLPEVRVRAVQKFTLYGYAGDVPPATDEPLADSGWVPLARVNSDDFFRVMQPIDRPAQQACSITGAQGTIGRYRYLLWAVEPTQARNPLLLNNTFYAEFDVYGTP